MARTPFIPGGDREYQPPAPAPQTMFNPANLAQLDQFELMRQTSLPRVGEANIQRGRMQGREGEPSVYPRSLGGFDILGSQIGAQPGAAVNVPSGQRIS